MRLTEILKKVSSVVNTNSKFNMSLSYGAGVKNFYLAGAGSSQFFGAADGILVLYVGMPSCTIQEDFELAPPVL